MDAIPVHEPVPQARWEAWVMLWLGLKFYTLASLNGHFLIPFVLSMMFYARDEFSIAIRCGLPGATLHCVQGVAP